MINLKTNYMGLELKNPIIAGASSLSIDLETLKRVEKAGAGAVVIKSLYEEEIQLDRFRFDEDMEKYEHVHAEMTTIYPNIKHTGPKRHLHLVKRAKEILDIPVIASLNAVNLDTWVEYAKALEKTGVDGLELNFYSLDKSMEVTGEEIEEEQLQILRAVKKAISIPVAIKLSPYYSSISNFSHKLDEENVDGLILFNRLFQPEIDIQKEEEIATFELSNDNDHKLPLRWTALLGNRLKADIISSSGIMSSEDIIRMLLAGATGVQVVSTLYKNKIEYIETMLKNMKMWMEDKGYHALDDFRGKLSKDQMSNPWAYERSQYITMLTSNNYFED